MKFLPKHACRWGPATLLSAFCDPKFDIQDVCLFELRLCKGMPIFQSRSPTEQGAVCPASAIPRPSRTPILLRAIFNRRHAQICTFRSLIRFLTLQITLPIDSHTDREHHGSSHDPTRRHVLRHAPEELRGCACRQGARQCNLNRRVLASRRGSHDIVW